MFGYLNMLINAKENTKIMTDVVRDELNLFRPLRQGDLVKGTVIEKGVRFMTLDLGSYGVGAVYRGEIQNAREIIKNLNPEDEVSAKVVIIDNEDGYIELSLMEADKQKSWEAVTEIKEKEEVFKVKILAFNKGGLVTDIKGLQAFLPVSQLQSGLEEKSVFENKDDLRVVLEKLVGEEVEVKIIDVNPRTKKLIISERATKEISTKELLEKYSEGQTIDGIVSGIADFGVFVRFTDNPEVEGLIHVSELSYRIVENPKEIIKIDEEISRLIHDAYERTKQLLGEHRDKLELIAEALLKYEVLYAADVDLILAGKQIKRPLPNGDETENQTEPQTDNTETA